MVKKQADIFLSASNSIKICVVIFIVSLLHSHTLSSANSQIKSSEIYEITKYCKGEALIVKVFDIPQNSKIDSIHFISSDSTLKYNSPTFFTKEDTLLLFFNSDTLYITGNITIRTFVGGTSNTKESQIRIVPKPQITKQPIDFYACQGDQVQFSIDGTNYDRIRWQNFRPDGSQWNYYTTEEKKDLLITANKLTNDNHQFRAVLSHDDVCFDTTKVATLKIDTIRPIVVSCPENITISIDESLCEKQIILPKADFSDECGINNISFRRSDGYIFENIPFKIGTWTITFEAYDKSGNTASCTYQLTVDNNQVVKIPCKPEETLYLDNNCQVRFNHPLKILPPCSTTEEQIFVSRQTFNQQGIFSVRHFSFHPKVEECITQVTVLDTFSYRIVHKPDDIITLDTDPGKCTRTILPDLPRITNSCTPNRDYVDLITPWPDNNEFQIGETEIQWGIFQFDGKVDTITQLITINDVSVPTVNCPGTYEAYLDSGKCSDWFDIPRLSEGGACGPVTISNNITGKDDASGNYGAGEFTINWSVTANNNFLKTCSQSIIIYSYPTARKDIANTVQDIKVTIPILDNDDDCIDQGLLMASLPINSMPFNGTALLDANQNLVYTPNSGFFGIDSLKYLITNTQNLPSEAWVVITVAEEPEPLVCEITNWTNTTGFGISDGLATVSVTGGIGPYSFQWSNGQTTATAINLPAGKHNVTIFDSGGQSTSCDVTIEEPGELTCEVFILMKISTFGANDGKATVTVKGGTEPYTYLWDNGQISAQADGLLPGIQAVTVTDANSYETHCQVELEEPKEPCQFLIPDGFSPNGDGIGDRFYIRCIEEYPDANIEIFNRYGQLLYQHNNYGNTDVWGETDAFWDGRPNRGIKPFNSILPSGTYFYVFNPGDGSKPATGSIYLNTNREGMK